MKPILLLDVDGVLNPFPFDARRSSDWHFEEFISTKASGGWTLHISKEMGDALWDLDCDIRWLTTWEDHAHHNIGGPVFGWPTLPVFFKDEGSFFWKADRVKRLLQKPGPPVIWVDDDLEEVAKCIEDWDEFDPYERLHMWPGIQSSVGLTKDDIQCLESLVRELTKS